MKNNNKNNSLISRLMDRIANRVVSIIYNIPSPINVVQSAAELNEFNALKYSFKQQGYALSRMVYNKIKSAPVPQYANEKLHFGWKPSTQVDVESEWFRYWCAELQTAPLTHRKLWEFTYVLQNLFHFGLLKPGASAIGFGCGQEPLPSYFASKGIRVTVTDLEPARVRGMGWAETGQHTVSIDASYHANLVDKDAFDELVSLRYVDMNHIPDDLNGKHDFCWSICALEHLGSVAKGIDFIKASLRCLKPGGLAIHTTEFNYTSKDQTIDNRQTVLFLRKHFEKLHSELKNQGFEVGTLDFDVGNDPLDCFVDLPPYNYDEFLSYTPISSERADSFRLGHLKVSVYGYPSTCFGITIRAPA